MEVQILSWALAVVSLGRADGGGERPRPGTSCRPNTNQDRTGRLTTRRPKAETGLRKLAGVAGSKRLHTMMTDYPRAHGSVVMRKLHIALLTVLTASPAIVL